MAPKSTASPYAYVLDLLFDQIDAARINLDSTSDDIVQIASERVASFATAFSVIKTGATTTEASLASAIAYLNYEASGWPKDSAEARQIKAAVTELEAIDDENEDEN